jgi:glucoamylase
MPLAWAHAEHIKLLRSLADGRVFDLPPQTHRRYQVEGVRSRLCVWSFNQKARSVTSGSILRVELLAAASVHWSSDGWRTMHDTATRDSGLGIHFADLDTAALQSGAEVIFTFYWPAAERWEGTDWRVSIAAGDPK